MTTKGSSHPLMGSVKYREDLDFGTILNDSLKVFFKDALRVALTNPSQAIHFIRTVRWQKKSQRIRASWQAKGVHVPPILIFSITNQCNLKCKGCYNWALRPSAGPELDAGKIKSILSEARQLGISFVMIAGGEPLVRSEILDITAGFPEITFLVFTNGMMIDASLAEKFEKQRNFIPVLSLEGAEADTDLRRGEGVYRRLRQAIEQLEAAGVFWSVSITVSRANFDLVTQESFIRQLVEHGCKLVFMVEYTPVSADTQDWLITDNQRAELTAARDCFRSKYPALFVAIPGDEEEIGGCLSAGRGFVHINASGDVEPCPFAPYSDVNLNNTSLKQALQSEFLAEIRRNHQRLSEAEGGCALWAEREWLQSLMQKHRPTVTVQEDPSG